MAPPADPGFEPRVAADPLHDLGADAPAALIRRKRDGEALPPAAWTAFARGLADGGWSDAQAAAMAMAIVWRGLDRAETSALTAAMADSGERLTWRDGGFSGPVLDKHSTGGVGDKVSLLLAPLLAACGAVVPMVSGRGLGHTGGTLDKLEALPGYDVGPVPTRLHAALRSAGCAIVGAGARLAPADRRLYAIRDVTATVESVPLITASILSKKLAAGLQALVMDVKVGSGAFCRTRDAARELARSIVEVAAAAGLPTVALLTDMDQVLGRTAGHALEVRESIDALRDPAGACPRLRRVTLALAGEALALGGLAATGSDGEVLAARAWDDGRAADRLARMVAALGGPPDVLTDARLVAAPVRREVTAPVSGVLAALDARAVGLAVQALGGGRRRGGEAIDLRVGVAEVLPLGHRVDAGAPLAVVHAADAASADAVAASLARAWVIAPNAAAAGGVGDVDPVLERVVIGASGAQ